MTVCATFKGSKCQKFNGPCDIENKAKVRNITCNKRSCHNVNIKSLPHMVTNFWTCLSIPLVIMGKFNFNPYNPDMRTQ